jgi:hypothetical protein
MSASRFLRAGAIVRQHGINLVANFEPTFHEEVVIHEVETLRQQIFECVGANRTTILDRIEYRRCAYQFGLNRRDAYGFKELH